MKKWVGSFLVGMFKQKEFEMENNVEKKWKELPIKDKISYVTAIGMIVSGIILAFLSFFLNQYDIATGVLIYIAQCFVIGGGLIGASVYFKSKWLEFNTNAKNKFKEMEDEIVDRLITYDREK